MIRRLVSAALGAFLTIGAGAARVQAQAAATSPRTYSYTEVGTPFFPAPERSVLFLEEVGERPYRIDRALTHLRLAGAFVRVVAVVVGELIHCEEKDGSSSPAEVVAEALGSLGIPVVASAPFGHGERNRAFAHGGRVLVDGTAGRVEFLEGAVA